MARPSIPQVVADDEVLEADDVVAEDLLVAEEEVLEKEENVVVKDLLVVVSLRREGIETKAAITTTLAIRILRATHRWVLFRWPGIPGVFKLPLTKLLF